MYSLRNLEPVRCSMSGPKCCFLTCMTVSQETGKVVRYFHHLKNFPHFVVIHTVKGFRVVNEAKVNVLLKFKERYIEQWNRIESPEVNLIS